jgi:hypothetical protein
LVSALLLRIRFLNSVLEDVTDDGLVPADITPMFGLLKILAKLKPRAIQEELAKLKRALAADGLVERVGLTELRELEGLVEACLT